jgi:hypothetical protein
MAILDHQPWPSPARSTWPPRRLPPGEHANHARRRPHGRAGSPTRRGPESEIIRRARRLAIEAAMRRRHPEGNGHSPQQDQHPKDEGHPAGNGDPGHREHCPGEHEHGPAAGAHGAGQPHQADYREQRPSTNLPADPPCPRVPPEPRGTVPASRPRGRGPHHQALPMRSQPHTPRRPFVRPQRYAANRLPGHQPVITPLCRDRGAPVPGVNGTLMARKTDYGFPAARPRRRSMALTCAFTLGAGDGNRTRTISLGS